MSKLGFIINGKNGRKQRFDKEFRMVADQLQDYTVDIQVTKSTGDATHMARQMADAGFTHIIAVGGDGTLNETINGIKKSAHPRCSVGMLFYGTANDFAKTISPPKSLPLLIEAIKKDRSKRLDLGLIEQKIGDLYFKRYFINIADLGIGAQVVKKVNESRNLFGADFTFFSAIIRTFFDYSNQPVTCETEDWQWEGRINSLVIANGKYFGSGLCIAPQADPTDGKFAIVITGDITIKDYLKNLTDIRKGRVLDHPKVTYRSAQKLRITSPSLECLIEADGELVGGLPVVISIEKGAINFII